MKVIVKTVFFGAVLAATIGLARSEPSTSVGYKKTEIKQMLRGARSAQDYRALAEYFSTQQKKFEQKALVEKQEWERRSQNVMGPAAKYPRPVDSSRNRFEYFSYEAYQMNQQAVKYQALAEKSQ
jgi:hypothetical protein